MLQQTVEVRPFLRWAGSKRKLIKQLRPFIPATWNKYFEPFLGSGALFFALAPARAEISDSSSRLIETYRAVAQDPEGVIDFLEPLKPEKLTFERIKSTRFRKNTSQAGAFIYLNKSCWNGLYRVNSKGDFNVPFGWPRSDFIVDRENLYSCARLLRRKGVSLRSQDFQKIENRVSEGDFVFLDPPYVTSHNANGFVDWNERLFSWKDQLRLAKMALRLKQRGANVLITNANHPDVCALYEDFDYACISRFSGLASDVTRRKTSTEAVFFGGPFYGPSSQG